MNESIDPFPTTPESMKEGARRMHLQVQVTADFGTALEIELAAMMHERLTAFRQRFRRSKFQLRMQSSLKYVVALGLSLSVAMIYLDSISRQSIKIDIAFFILFSLIFFLTWDMEKFIARRDNLVKPYWGWLARSGASSMLRMAKKTWPFTAKYELRDDIIAYYRITSTGSKLAWTRSLKHCYLSGQHATLFYKKETSLYPYILIMHEAPQELAQYLDALGLPCLNSTQDT
ncbi:hypothetical protein ACO0LG_08245 [Undibacterium sp. Ji42W]|uniref:hypothetical protein n=1 Tax=Undibacterium sp. Ji42W TaxID=3413039 RepID=UPI003BF04DBD